MLLHSAGCRPDALTQMQARTGRRHYFDDVNEGTEMWYCVTSMRDAMPLAGVSESVWPLLLDCRTRFCSSRSI